MKLGQVKILDTINKIPGGLMVVPLILGVTVNTLFPDFFEDRKLYDGAFQKRR